MVKYASSEHSSTVRSARICGLSNKIRLQQSQNELRINYANINISEKPITKVVSKLIYRLQMVHHRWFVQQNPWISVALRIDTSNTQVSCETKLFFFWSQSVCKYHAEFLTAAHTLVDVSSCRQQTTSPAIFCTIITSNFLA